jgi:Tfp pilus assembly ATPase PilU
MTIERVVAQVIGDVQDEIVSQYAGREYDLDSWEIFVGNKMQRILDAIAVDDRRRSAETLDHAIHDASGYDPGIADER